VALRDEVLVLRPPAPSDQEQVVAAVQMSLTELEPWMPWASAEYGAAGFGEYLRGSRQRGDRPLLICEADGAVVGGTGLNQIDTGNRRVNLGYWVRSGRARRGYATRAARLTARWAVVELGFERIDIVMSVENLASRAVAQKLGASHEGVLRSALLLRGRRHDAHSYSLLAREVRAWAPSPVYL
jgi:RimJ/RimL family protein N-acetyltransferase